MMVHMKFIFTMDSKLVHRVNIKPDTRKLTMLPVDKLEYEKEIIERKERRQQMASARAERARKRSAEISPTPVIPVKRKDNRGRKPGRTQE
ncbi:hypothetical protein OS493_014492 [Desmophyllum pertusum]|uniref:Uncharacterized protein n=1 Tax=Desmophyllum pertusum TaxID=174260 RepID=A0A9W9YPM6_9CNID|nr:hypothetical protein OS493_014492 [Desmophyllum pertusum]